MKEYLDFDLEIKEGGPREYPVAVDSPGGQAQEQMHFPFDDWELENKLLALENALLRSGGSRRSISPEEQTVKEFGERLFKAVLTGDIRTRYEVSLRVARQQNKGLRLKLHIQPPKLALLPWEFLYDPDSGEYLCFSSSTPLVRYVDLRRPIEQLPVTPPLRILGMVASPTDLPQLDVEHEKRLVEEAVKVLQAKGLVELTWLEEQTWSALQEAMWGGPWHIFHFVGHGDFDPNSGEGRVAFSNETTGYQEVLAARHLARLLDDHHDLRLAFLNSCEGAKGSEGDPFSGTAATLVRRGVPAVVAMQYDITDKAAIAFSRAFYHAVANGLPVDAAVSAARTAVSINDTLEWGTPVLYMRSPDGRLFDIKKEEIEEEEPLSRYREAVQTSWTSGELHEREAEELRDVAHNELGLSSSTAADIEREVMGETKEAILQRREQAAKEQYRKVVEAAWTDDDLSNVDAERLHTLATELGLSANTAADIEREVTGDTVQAIIQRQTREEEARQQHLEELYARARWSHQNREWQAVIAVFDQIHSEAPTYPDPEELLKSAHEALEREHRVTVLYDRGQRYVEAEEWRQALECLEEVQRLEPGYRETETLLSQVRRQLAPPPVVEVPNLSGQNVHQASATLTNRGLKVSVQSEIPSDTVFRGQVIEQSPEAGREVGAGSSVNITVSSGPRLQPLMPALAGSWWALALRGLVLAIFGLTELIKSLLVLDFKFFQFAALFMIADGVFAIIDAASSRYRRRPLLVQGIISGVVGLLTLSIATLPTAYFPSYNPTFAATGSWAIFIGMIRIIATIQRWWEIKTFWLMGMSGVLLVVSGILLAVPYGFPWWFLGSWSLASGITLVKFAFRARDRAERGSRVA